MDSLQRRFGRQGSETSTRPRRVTEGCVSGSLRRGNGLGTRSPWPLAAGPPRHGELEAAGVALILHQQAIDTPTPAGRMFFQVTGAFAEFERAMIRSPVRAGLERAKARGVLLGCPPEQEPRRRPPYVFGWQLGRASRRSRRRLASATARCRASRRR